MTLLLLFCTILGWRQMCAITAKVFAATSAVRRPFAFGSQSKTDSAPQFCEKRPFFSLSRKRKRLSRRVSCCQRWGMWMCVCVQTYRKREREREEKVSYITIWLVVWQCSLTFCFSVPRHPLLLSLPGLGIWHHSGENKSPTSLVGAGLSVSVVHRLFVSFSSTHIGCFNLQLKNLGKPNENSRCWKKIHFQELRKNSSFFIVLMGFINIWI